MTLLYENPPIVEAVCEFRFLSSLPWDWTIPGLVYEKLKAEYPKKRAKKLEFDWNIEAQKPVEALAMLQFLREDETALVQVGPDLVSINNLRPYKTWRTFKKMIENVFSVYREAANPKAINRIGVRYINRIETHQEKPNIEDYLLAAPKVPDTIPQIFVKWAQRVEIPFEHVNGLLALQSGSMHEPNRTTASLILDLDFSTLDAGKVEMETALQWVESAHSELEKSFEACITQKSRSLFTKTKETT